MKLTYYIVRQMMVFFVIISGIFVVLSIGSRASDILGGYISRNLPVETILPVLWSFVPETFLVIFGLGIFLSVILTLTKLNHHSEMPIIFNSGLSSGFLMRCVLWFILPWLPLILWLSLSYAPEAKISGKRAFERANVSLNLVFEPGLLQNYGESMLYASKQGNQEQIGFVARFLENGKPYIISAQESQNFQKDGQTWIRFNKGFQLVDSTNGETTELMHFETLELTLPQIIGQAKQIGVNDPNFAPFAQLLDQADSQQARTEIHWRFSYAISAILMALLAVFLVPYRPRGGRFISVAVGLVIFVFYATLVTTLKRLSEEGTLNPDIAFGGLYALIVLLIAIAWMNHQRLFQLKKKVIQSQ